MNLHRTEICARNKEVGADVRGSKCEKKFTEAPGPSKLAKSQPGVGKKSLSPRRSSSRVFFSTEERLAALLLTAASLDTRHAGVADLVLSSTLTLNSVSVLRDAGVERKRERERTVGRDSKHD